MHLKNKTYSTSPKKPTQKNTIRGVKSLLALLSISFFLTGCCDIPLIPFVEKNTSQNNKKHV